MRISITGDDGLTRSLAVLSKDFQSSQVVIGEISADNSGRSFLIKLPGLEVFYLCSEKSKMHGMRLLAKVGKHDKAVDGNQGLPCGTPGEAILKMGLPSSRSKIGSDKIGLAVRENHHHTEDLLPGLPHRRI